MDTDSATESADAAGEESTPTHAGRTTAPQQPYSMRQVGTGIVVLAVGLVVAYLLPLAF